MADDSSWVLVSASQDYKGVVEQELVLLAVGIQTRIERASYGWTLSTKREMGSLARKQLALYRNENRYISIQRAPSPVIDRGIVGVVGFVVVIWFVWILDNLFLIENFKAHADMWALAVREGEWWRTVTALLLHADASHIIGNTVFGLLFGWIAGRYYGSGVAWLLIVVCGAMGNFLNAQVQGDMFHSIGASTATFAAAGLVAGLFYRRRFIQGRGWRYNAIPIVGAIGIFAMFGVGGVRTDVMAHITGLLCGIVGGTLVGGIDFRRLGRSGQILGAIATLAIIAAACFSA